MAPKRPRNERSPSLEAPSHNTPTAAAQSSNTTYTRPRTRQRLPKSPAPLTVPNIDEDAAERKRVLNVLAQRRYRERKRQSKTGEPASTTTPQGSETKSSESESNPAAHSRAATEEVNADIAIDLPGPNDIPDSGSAGETDLLGDPAFLDLDFPSGLSPGMFDLAGDTLTSLPNQGRGLPNLDLGGREFTLGGGNGAAVPPPLPSGPSSDTVDPNIFLRLFSPPPSDTSSNSATTPMSADSYLLPVHELTILRAILRIAARLGCSGTFWDLSANSPFCPAAASAGGGINGDGSMGLASSSPSSSSAPSAPAAGGLGGTVDAAHLPRAWQPTTTQLVLPHHPIMDFLPWPSVRDKIIAVFSLPEPARPPAASGPLALVEFAYDMEDSAEGMRIWGADPYDPSGWEVGQVVFEKWWFIFDRQVVEQSNRWRAARGAAALEMRSDRGWEMGSVVAG